MRATGGEEFDRTCDALGLDAFQRIAVAEISRELDIIDPTGHAKPEPGSEHDLILRRLRRIILEPPRPHPDDA